MDAFIMEERHILEFSTVRLSVCVSSIELGKTVVDYDVFTLFSDKVVDNFWLRFSYPILAFWVAENSISFILVYGSIAGIRRERAPLLTLKVIATKSGALKFM